ncbi:MAG: oligoendopeptidase [Gaiellales bacterium]|jgi:oligoendopeptidase F|nr:oligoendopeptidase [Gaiellales bacterium]
MSVVQASGVRWDLSPLFGSADEGRGAVAELLDDAATFEQTWRGRMADIEPPELAEALEELGELDNRLSRIASYASLRRSVDVTSDENRDLAAAVDQALVQAQNLLRFFELEWLALDDEQAGLLADAPELERDRHHLLSQRRYREHVLSEAEERALGERNPAAVSAWQSLYAQTTSTIEVPFDAGDGEEQHTIDRLLAYVHDPRRDVRLRALETLYEALEPLAPVLAHCYDSLVADRLVIDRVRNYGDDPMSQTHLRNELDAEIVETMMQAVERRYDLAQRWFAAKAGLLGLDVLELGDQYAPIGEARGVEYDEGRALVDSAFAGFSERIRQVSDEFFTEHRVDAEPRVGKRGGAFCSPVAQDARPYVMLNYTDRMNDVLTMAHELGHGMHFQLSHEKQTPHSAHTGLALAEVPSTFAEFVAYDHLLANESDPETRRVLSAGRAEGAFATVFRQTVLARYEQRAYGMRAGATALTPDRLGDAWLEENVKYYGDSISLPEGYRLGWSYIPHFISTRFYTYAYVFAKLVALALYARWRDEGEDFVPAYLEFLAAGGSAAPADLLGALGVDVRDPATWDRAFDELERMVAEAENEAQANIPPA